MIGRKCYFIHRLGLRHRWSVFHFFILFFYFFSFGDIRLGWFVCVEKKFLLQLGVFNTRTIVEFFFLGGGRFVTIFCARLDSRTRKSDHHQRHEYCLHLCNIYRLVGGIGNALYILVCASFILPCFIVSMATCLSFFGD